MDAVQRKSYETTLQISIIDLGKAATSVTMEHAR